MDEMAKITDRLQYIFVKAIINGFRDKTITVRQAKKWATDLLALKPLSSFEEAEQKIAAYVADKKPLIQMKKFLDVYNEEKRLESVIEKMKKHLRKNEIDEALQVAKNH